MLSDKLIENIIKKRSPIVVGLDPRFESLPADLREKHLKKEGNTLKAVSSALIEFNRGIVDAVYDLVPAVKPQIAFYEQYGIEGMIAYKDVCDYAKSRGLIVVADVKRGDIGSTSKAYSNAHLGKVNINGEMISAFEADFATINPYLGNDCMSEFMDDVKTYEKGLFILVKTSNKTSGQLQDLKSGDETIYEKVADIVSKWNDEICGETGYSPIGAVVGATYPEELISLRKQMPKAIFLVPGYGAQGGGAQDVLGAFNEDGLGAIVNNSRGILFAYQKSDLDYKEAAREAVIKMRNDINEALEKDQKKYW
ncbi:orotidine-5'-phosphate decarboxylase [Fusibacter sp. 3D3]|uniref:orotidine-5'-phosphate decarboxylase n=1 Tax=Fusibacter sp. 3D3 TaxID=1048380 RepID=UPI0008535EB5|nr:orotidine-5'-phosphate decarboxylase [Fusibacter sp. 3D3]GAU80001.1 orotidine 5'-phosphate decarboxylase [Fusibacter sp. 3D3]